MERLVDGVSVEVLEAANGYCECPALEELFNLRRQAVSLEMRCGLLQGGLDLDDPKPKDLPTIFAYDEATTNLRKAADAYHWELLRLSQGRKIELRDVPNSPYETINCVDCNQQIDIVD